uniref:Spy/CpxP family protein refolding chaperone n=2 Tax=Roseivirga sp. TaxID=1964215 RepID=UPI00404872FA
MKTQRSKWLGILAAALLLTNVNINAQDNDDRERPRAPRKEMAQGGVHEPGEKGPKIPDLTEEQKEQLRGFHVAAEKTALPIKNKLSENEARLKTLTTSEGYDAKAVDKVIDEIGKLKTDLLKLRVSTDQKIRGILTEEQLVFFNNHTPKKGQPSMKGRR